MLLRDSRVATSVNMRPFDLKGVQAVEKRKEDEKIKKRNMGQKNGNGKKWMQNELNGCSDFFFPMRGKKERRREKKVWQFVSVIYELNFAKDN